MAIEIQDLQCSYNSTPLFKGVDLTIDTHLTILGANGAGKSTFAKALCALTPYSGKIYLNTKELRNFSAKELARHLFYVPTKLESFDTRISVFEFVLLSRFAHKDPFFEYSLDDKQRAKESLEKLFLTHLSDHALSSLSSGESALVLIAAALCSQSQIIIFDEPTANLDPANAKKVATHIKELKKTHTILLITHDLHLACFLQSPVAFLKEGVFSLFEDPSSFFDDAVLERLYGVKFHNLAVSYA